ncbi:MAG: MBL fold metallo-hydrolase [Candidatus Bathyarchaeota archaeon]|nr:MBL fold metallo-hydrolase [Candidatus Bathyarchaeota archaeon]
MKMKMFIVGRLLTNCYVVSCPKTGEAIIIDPGTETYGEAQQIIQYVERNNLKPVSILNTHGHPDHITGNRAMKEAFSIPILIHEGDAKMLDELGRRLARAYGFTVDTPPADRLLRDGEEVGFGVQALKVLHTPGHTPGSICLIGDNEIFTGDTLFAGSIGRVDFPESKEVEMWKSLKKIKALPDHFKAYPGHGPITTIGEEKRTNPYLTGRLL